MRKQQTQYRRGARPKFAAMVCALSRISDDLPGPKVKRAAIRVRYPEIFVGQACAPPPSPISFLAELLSDYLGSEVFQGCHHTSLRCNVDQ